MLGVGLVLLPGTGLAAGCQAWSTAAPSVVSPTPVATVLPTFAPGSPAPPEPTPARAPAAGAGLQGQVVPPVGAEAAASTGSRGSAPRPLALDGLRVALVDAAGAPLRDEAGAPRTTTTDARGHFRLAAPPTARPFILEVTLPDGLGAMRAFVPGGAPARPLVVDLAATLTATHLVARLLATTPDREQGLTRVPAAVEAAARAAASAALETRPPTQPWRLTRPATLATLDALRRATPALEALLAQLEQAVAAPAPQEANEGAVALQAWLTATPSQVWRGPDARVYFALDRIWRIDAVGRLEAVLGGGTLSPEAAEGRPGREARVETHGGFCFGPDDRLEALADGRLVRLEADGTLTTVEPRVPPAARLLGRAGQAWLLATLTPSGVAVSRLTPGGRLTALARVPAPPECHPIGCGLDTAAGEVVVGFQQTGPEAQLRLFRIETGSGTVSPWRAPAEARPPARVTHQGRLVGLVAGQPRVWQVSGEAPRNIRGADVLPTSLYVPDDRGPALLAHRGGILSESGGALQRLAGAVTPAERPAEPPLAPESLAPAADGSLWLIDAEQGALVQLGPDGSIRPVELSGDARARDGAAAWPRRLRRGPDGAVWLEVVYADDPEPRRPGLCRLSPDGRGTFQHQASPGSTLMDFAPGAGGRCHMVVRARGGGTALVERNADGALRTLLEQPAGVDVAPDAPLLEGCDLAVASDGTVWLLGEGRLARFRAGAGYQVVLRGARFTRPRAPLRSLELGPDGALYYTPGGLPAGDERVMRVDPQTRNEAVVVGLGLPAVSAAAPPAPHSPAFTAAGELVYLDARSHTVHRVAPTALAGRPYLPPTAPGEPE
jgi:hypothetical protein